MRLRSLPAAIGRRLGPAAPPPTPREARARRAFEVVTAAAVVAGAAALLGRPATPDLGPPWASLPVDVATDGASRLRLLPGIGPARLRAILRDRAVSGPVPSVEALDRVPGLGPRTVEALRRAGATVGRGVAPTSTGSVAPDGGDASGRGDAGPRAGAGAGP
ncbi:MAG: helix-hairpin-helix domain-containing protein [Planctomycetota bacterium]